MSFWHELHRRRVLRVLAVFAVINFVLLNALAGLVQYYQWPQQVMVLAIWLVIILTPIVAISAWYFDYTPWGILRTPARGELPKVPTGLMDRRVEAVIIGILLIALGVAIRGVYDDYAAEGAATASELGPPGGA